MFYIIEDLSEEIFFQLRVNETTVTLDWYVFIIRIF